MTRSRTLGRHILAVGLATMGLLGVVHPAQAAAQAPERPPVAVAVARTTPMPIGVYGMQLVFDEYGGPGTLGFTTTEIIYATCQQDGTWGWQTFAYVPSLDVNGWLRNSDLVGGSQQIWFLPICG